MILFYKNKGLLVPLYFGTSIIGTAVLSSILRFQVGGFFAHEYDGSIVVGLGSLIAAFWTYATHDSYYYSAGVKKPMKEDNSFFFVHMKTWSYIFEAVGIILLARGILITAGVDFL